MRTTSQSHNYVGERSHHPPTPSPANWLEQGLWLSFFAVFSASVGYVAWGLNKGIDLFDESLHVALMLAPEQYSYHFTPFGYLVHGLFGWLDSGVLTFRILGLLFNLGGTALFFLGFMAWLRETVPLDHGRVRKLGLFGIVGLANLSYYAHFARSVQYNSLNQFAVMAAGGLLLYVLSPMRQHMRAERRRIWAFGGLGLLLVFDFLVKFPTALSILMAALSTMAFLWITGRSDVPAAARQLGVLAAGVIVGIMLMWLFVLSPNEMVRQFGTMIALETSYAHGGMIEKYAERMPYEMGRLFSVMAFAMVSAALLLFVLIRLPALRWLPSLPLRWINWALFLAAASGMVWYHGSIEKTWIQNKVDFPRFWLGLVLVSLTWPLVLQKWARPAALQFLFAGLLLFTLPFGGAVGTANKLLFGTLPYLAAWMALQLAVLLWVEHRLEPPYRWFPRLVTVFLVIVMAEGVLYNYTYNSRNIGDIFAQTNPVPGIRAMRGIDVHPDIAARLTGVRAAVRAIPGFRDGDPVISIYRWPALPMVAGGYSPGVPWYFHQEHRQGYNCAIMDMANFPAERLIILQQNDPWPEFQRCLRRKGVNFPEDYRLSAEIGGTKVWAPAALAK